jgi:predicted O-methyltransferase YrrM
MFFRIIAYLNYLFTAKSEFGIHAPFAYSFYTKVIKSKTPVPDNLTEIEKLRKELSTSGEKVQVTDFGTGALKKQITRKVSDIVLNDSNSKKDVRLLFRIARFLEPETILELGTSLGFTTMYMAKAANKAQIISLEGCPEKARLARQNFIKAKTIIDVREGNIDQILPEIFKENFNPGIVFFDANHTKEATLRYFEICLSHVTEKTVFVFDDIYWSKEMKEAWLQIISSPQVVISIDLFRLGIVFFNKNSAKQHFILKY